MFPRIDKEESHTKSEHTAYIVVDEEWLVNIATSSFKKIFESSNPKEIDEILEKLLRLSHIW